ncbi:MAG: NAD-dependent epimerase/dehydratase family protein [Siphonobacter sp.]
MQTILGAGGAIANSLAKDLTQYTSQIRLVSRTPKAIHPTDELIAANLLDASQVDLAVAGSQVVYVTAGLEYKIKVWQEQWPIIMRNVLAACQKHQAKLVFFDNVYSYGLVEGIMTEQTPMNPVSKKGEVRARIAQQLLDETKAGNIQALIARAPDFYDPYLSTSIVDALVVQNLKKGKKAQWFCDAKKKHSLIYTPDAAKGTALLGNTPEAYGQVWHLPTAAPAPTGEEIIELYRQVLGGPKGYMTLPKWLLQGLGLFIPIMKEMVEMAYQYDHDYLFSSEKFEKYFQFQPTSYAEGIRQSV